MPKFKPLGAAINKAKGFGFMSETEYLGENSPSSSHYKLNERLVTKRTPSYKIVKPKGNRMHWKPNKIPGAAVGSYDIKTKLVLPKSVTTVMSKDKLRSVLDGVIRHKKKIPGVGDYNSHDCYDKISRPMKTTRV